MQFQERERENCYNVDCNVKNTGYCHSFLSKLIHSRKRDIYIKWDYWFVIVEERYEERGIVMQFKKRRKNSVSYFSKSMKNIEMEIWMMIKKEKKKISIESNIVKYS